MKEIKSIIAENLITLRKEHNLTQGELAKELSYSDNMVSRWERGEITPTIETLDSISKFYNIPLNYLLTENAVKKSAENSKIENMRKFSIILLLLSAVWFIATVFYVYRITIVHENPWLVFVGAVPVSCFVLLIFRGSWNMVIYRFVVLSVLVWSMLAFFYLYLLSYNFYLLFIVGVPMQVALVIWAFVKPKEKK